MGGISLIGAGSLLLGVVLMLVTRVVLPRFFTTGTLPPLPQADPGAAPAGRASPDAARSDMVTLAPRPVPGPQTGAMAEGQRA